MADIWANSGSPQDIQLAVDQAQAGDNVHVPEGDFVFNPNDAPSGQGVQILGGVNVFGAGKDKTILRQTRRVVGNIPMFSVDGRNGLRPRISGFTFKAYTVDEVEGYSATGVTMYCCKNFRVDHCKFIDFNNFEIYTGVYTVAVKQEDGVYQYYWNWGVVDHCDFDLPYKDTIGGSWGYGVGVFGPGRADAWLYNLSDIIGQFPETPPKCALYQWNPSTSQYDLIDPYGGKYFRWFVYIEDCTFSRCRHAIASNSGAFYVARHCTFQQPRPYPLVDVHGAGDIDWWGGRGAEIYDNTLDVNNIVGPSAIDYRAGGGAVFNNVIKNTSYGVRLSRDFQTTQFYVKDLWIWNNTFQNVGTQIHDYWGNTYTENIDYFLRERPSYAPYIYPHPLVSGETPPPTTPTTPFLGELEEGVYKVSVSPSIVSGSDTYVFKQWEDGSTNPVRIINLTSDMAITATYELLAPPPPGYHHLTIVAYNGTTNPTAGIYEIAEATTVQVTATPNTGCIFKHWLLDNVIAGLDPTITVAMDADHTLLAVCEPTPKFPVLQAGLGLLGVVGLVYLATRKG